MPAAVAIPAIASVAGSAIQSRGAKKAAKGNKGPQIPAQFQAPIGNALGFINQAFSGTGPGFSGPFASEIMNQGGLTTALQSLTQTAQSGINPADLQTIRQTYAPLFSQQKTDLLAGIRGSQAARGNYFGSGALQQESKGLADLIAGQGSQVVGLAQNAAQLRTSAATQLPGFIQSGVAAQNAPQMLGLQALTSLMGGTQFYNPVSAPNAGMNIGGAITQLAASPGFQAALRGKGGNAGASSSGTSGSFPAGWSPNVWGS